MSLDNNYSDENLEEVIEAYCASIPKKIQVFETLINSLIEDPSLGKIKELRMKAHQLGGSAGIYGFLPVSEICKDLVVKLDKYTLCENKLSNDQKNELILFLKNLKNEFVVSKQKLKK